MNFKMFCSMNMYMKIKSEINLSLHFVLCNVFQGYPVQVFLWFNCVYPIFVFLVTISFFIVSFHSFVCFNSSLLLHFTTFVTYTCFVMQDPDAMIMFSSACKPVPTTTMFWEVLTHCISYLMYTGSVSSSTGRVTSKYFFQRNGSMSVFYHKKKCTCISRRLDLPYHIQTNYWYISQNKDTFHNPEPWSDIHVSSDILVSPI